MGKINDLTGQKLWFLTVLKFADIRKNKARWLCKCDCGKETILVGEAIKSGRTKSCGCYHDKLASERLFKHGMKGTKEYNAWSNMWDRCHNEKSEHYALYSSKGRTVTDKWETFLAFYEDMGKAPSKKHTLERVDNDKGYFKENCIWATMDVQSKNRSDNVWVEINGEKMILSDAARKIGISWELFRYYNRKKGILAQDVYDKFNNKKSKTMAQVGIENLKKSAILGIQLGNAIETTLEDGFKLADLANFILPLSQLPAVVENKALIVEEFKDLDSAEKEALLTYVKTNLDLKNDKVEEIIEKGLGAVVAILELVSVLKKEDTPETPVV